MRGSYNLRIYLPLGWEDFSDRHSLPLNTYYKFIYQKCAYRTHMRCAMNSHSICRFITSVYDTSACSISGRSRNTSNSYKGWHSDCDLQTQTVRSTENRYANRNLGLDELCPQSFSSHMPYQIYIYIYQISGFGGYTSHLISTSSPHSLTPPCWNHAMIDTGRLIGLHHA